MPNDLPRELAEKRVLMEHYEEQRRLLKFKDDVIWKLSQELKKKYERDHEIAALKNALPGEADPNASAVGESKDKMLKVEKNDENRSLKTNRLSRPQTSQIPCP